MVLSKTWIMCDNWWLNRKSLMQAERLGGAKSTFSTSSTWLSTTARLWTCVGGCSSVMVGLAVGRIWGAAGDGTPHTANFHCQQAVLLAVGICKWKLQYFGTFWDSSETGNWGCGHGSHHLHRMKLRNVTFAANVPGSYSLPSETPEAISPQCRVWAFGRKPQWNY